MSHTIKRPRRLTTTPTGLYEANFRRLLRLMPVQLSANKTFSLAQAKITIKVLQQYKYTTVISLKKILHTQPESYLSILSHLSVIDMELRICHDACVVEVIGYQGKSPIQSLCPYPNEDMLQIDEKRQLNLFLKDVLENALKEDRKIVH